MTIFTKLSQVVVRGEVVSGPLSTHHARALVRQYERCSEFDVYIEPYQVQNEGESEEDCKPELLGDILARVFPSSSQKVGR